MNDLFNGGGGGLPIHEFKFGNILGGEVWQMLKKYVSL